MSDSNLPVKRIKINELSLDERAELSYRCFHDWATKGLSYKKLSEIHNITTHAVKKLIEEHAAHERASNPANKARSSAGYKFIIEKAHDIIENPNVHPVMVRAKAFDAYIQASTRLDKLEGNESPQMNISADAETVADWIRRAQKAGDLDSISPSDHAAAGTVDYDIEVEAEEDG